MASREKFGGRAAVILALAGSAIGLGNIWRFPYLVGMNGGAAFIVIYIGFVLLLSIPIFLAESIIGRSSGTNCRAAIGRLVPGRAGRWFYDHLAGTGERHFRHVYLQHMDAFTLPFSVPGHDGGHRGVWCQERH